jgi:hypothetical protein
MSHSKLFYTRLRHCCDYTIELPSGKLLEILTAEFSLFAGAVAPGPPQHTVFESMKLDLKRMRQHTQALPI